MKVYKIVCECVFVKLIGMYAETGCTKTDFDMLLDLINRLKVQVVQLCIQLGVYFSYSNIFKLNSKTDHQKKSLNTGLIW